MSENEKVSALLRKFIVAGARKHDLGTLASKAPTAKEVFNTLGEVDDVSAKGASLRANQLYIILLNTLNMLEIANTRFTELLKINPNITKIIRNHDSNININLNHILILMISYPKAVKKIAALADSQIVTLLFLLLKNQRFIKNYIIRAFLHKLVQYKNTSSSGRSGLITLFGEVYEKLGQESSEILVIHLFCLCNFNRREVKQISRGKFNYPHGLEEARLLRHKRALENIIQFKRHLLPFLRRSKFEVTRESDAYKQWHEINLGIMQRFNDMNVMPLVIEARFAAAEVIEKESAAYRNFVIQKNRLKERNRGNPQLQNHIEQELAQAAKEHEKTRLLTKYAEQLSVYARIDEAAIAEEASRLGTLCIDSTEKDPPQVAPLIEIDAARFKENLEFVAIKTQQAQQRCKTVLSNLNVLLMQIYSHYQQRLSENTFSAITCAFEVIKLRIQRMMIGVSLFSVGINNPKLQLLLQAKIEEQNPTSTTDDSFEDSTISFLTQRSIIITEIESMLCLDKAYTNIEEPSSILAECKKLRFKLDFDYEGETEDKKIILELAWNNFKLNAQKALNLYRAQIEKLPDLLDVSHLEKLRQRTLILRNKIQAQLVKLLSNANIFPNRYIYSKTMHNVCANFINLIFNLEYQLKNCIKLVVGHKTLIEYEPAGGGEAGGGAETQHAEVKDKTCKCKLPTCASCNNIFIARNLIIDITKLNTRDLELIRKVINTKDKIQHTDLIKVFTLLELNYRKTAWHHIKVTGNLFYDANEDLSVGYSVHHSGTISRFVEYLPYGRKIQGYLKNIGVMQMLELATTAKAAASAKP